MVNGVSKIQTRTTVTRIIREMGIQDALHKRSAQINNSLKVDTHLVKTLGHLGQVVQSAIELTQDQQEF